MAKRKTVRASSTLEEREARLTQRLKALQLQKQIRDLRTQMKGGK